MSLPEILTILLGILLSLIIFDGFRRALRSRKAGLKVDLMSPESIEEVLQDNEEYSNHFCSVVSVPKEVDCHRRL